MWLFHLVLDLVPIIEAKEVAVLLLAIMWLWLHEQ